MKLYRSSKDSKLFGLCGGIAQSTGTDPTLVRLAMVIGAFVTGGTLFFIYILASMVIPREPYGYEPKPFRNQTPGYAYASAAQEPFATVRETSLDLQMKDLEQKAMLRELEALKAKLSRYEANQSEGDR